MVGHYFLGGETMDHQQALADVHRWICDNLSNGDAGRLCSMLSSVSRYISEIETKNERLRCNYVNKVMYISVLEQRIIYMYDENAKLREQLQNAERKEGDESDCDWKGTTL
jgi:hypothetical protein